MTKDGGSVSATIVSLSWMPSRTALVLRDSRRDKRFRHLPEPHAAVAPLI